MKCIEIEGLLSEYIDEVLDPQKKVKVEEHLKVCPNCSRELDALRQTVCILQSMGEVEPPPNFKYDVMAKIKGESNTVLPMSTHKPKFFTMSSASFRYAAAAVIVFGLCTGVILRAINDPQNNPITKELSIAKDDGVVGKTDEVAKEVPKTKASSTPDQVTLDTRQASSSDVVAQEQRVGLESNSEKATKMMAVSDSIVSHKSKVAGTKVTDRSLTKKTTDRLSESSSNPVFAQKAVLFIKVDKPNDFDIHLQQLVTDNQAFIENKESLPEGGTKVNIKVMPDKFGSFYDGIIKDSTLIKGEITGQPLTDENKQKENQLFKSIQDQSSTNSFTYQTPADAKYSYIELTIN